MTQVGWTRIVLAAALVVALTLGEPTAAVVVGSFLAGHLIPSPGLGPVGD